MLDHDELRKYFSKSQQQDMIDLDIMCMQNPPGRIRRARVRKVKPDHIPRPVNSFMSYRTEKQSIIKKLCPTANHRDISKMVAKWWHNIGSAEKSIYVDKAKAAKDVHNEKYPDYTFRPKTKTKRSKKLIDKKKDEADFEVDDDEHADFTAARTRPYVRTVKSHKISSLPNVATTYPDLYSFGMHDNTFKNNNITSCSNNNIYCDEVLFQTKEDQINNTNYWGTTYDSSEQVMANEFPSITSTPQEPCYSFPISYYPALTSSTLNHEPAGTIDPLATNLNNFYYPGNIFNVMPTGYQNLNTNNMSNGGGYINSDESQFNYEITPYSQAMSTPMLDYTRSPLSPGLKASAYLEAQEEKCFDYAERRSCMFENMLPTDVLSPSVTAHDNFVWSNGGGGDVKPSLLDNYDLFGNAIN